MQAALGKTLADTVDCQRRDLDLLGNDGIFVCAAFFSIVGQEQDAGAFAFSFGMALGLAQAHQLITLGLGQRNMIFFRGHGISLLRLIHSARFS